MSCCNDCASGMGNCGSGLHGLMGELAAGSRVRTGFEFNYNLGYDPAEIESQIVSYVQEGLYSYLADDVTFSDVNIAVQAPTFFSQGYITVSATSRTPLPSANVFGDMVAYGIGQYLSRLVVTRRDETLVDFYGQGQPQGAPSPGVPSICDWDTMDLRDWMDCQLGIGKFSKTPQQQQQQQQNQLPPAPPPPGQCVWSQMTFGDYIACQLGIKGAVQGAAAGATGAIIGVFAIGIAAVILLKR
jgi:hypothetical protein